MRESAVLPRAGWFPLSSVTFCAAKTEQEIAGLRRMIWLYFWLLMLEGSLRKWIPPLSAPLLIVRDPLVLQIYFEAIRCRRVPLDRHMLVYFVLLVSFILLATIQIVAGIGGGPLVAAYGLRTDFLHLPLIFIIPQVFGYRDVLKLGKWVLLLTIPMTVLMVFQFLAPPDAWINAATMTDLQQIDSAMGKIRPAGTFSFATGAAHFFVLATTFLVFGLMEEHSGYSRWLLYAALVSVAAVQPVSGSRTLVLGCGIVLLAALSFGVLNPTRAHRILALLALIAIVTSALSFTSFFQEGVMVFTTRWENANAATGGIQEGLVGRFFGYFLEPLRFVPQAGLLGNGIGMGTGAGAVMMTGALQFLLAEGEWARVVLESGTLLGFSFLAYRVWLGASIAQRALAAARQQQLLPWLFAWYATRSLLSEGISQPTNLGFMVLASGLCLASIRPRDASRTYLQANGF